MGWRSVFYSTENDDLLNKNTRKDRTVREGIMPLKRPAAGGIHIHFIETISIKSKGEYNYDKDSAQTLFDRGADAEAVVQFEGGYEGTAGPDVKPCHVSAGHGRRTLSGIL